MGYFCYLFCIYVLCPRLSSEARHLRNSRGLKKLTRKNTKLESRPPTGAGNLRLERIMQIYCLKEMATNCLCFDWCL
jgi:hypothetical protein